MAVTPALDHVGEVLREIADGDFVARDDVPELMGKARSGGGCIGDEIRDGVVG